jgi:magnesium transporter
MGTSLLAPAVPSKSLIRFLRSQSDVCFFTSNTYASHSRPTANNHDRKRHISFTSSKRARVEDIWLQHGERTVKALPPPRGYIHHDHRSHARAAQTRHASTKAPPHQSLFHRLLRLRGDALKKTATDHTNPFQPDEDTTRQLFNLSRALSRNPSGADLKLRCTEFDSNGSVTLVSGEFKKSELIAKYGLQPRDLRKIDSSILPHILVRPSAILINLLHLRVLIQSDRVLVFDAYGSTDSYTQSLFMYDLEGKLRQKADPRANTNGNTYLPYEFRALEAVLISVTSGLEAEFELVRDPVVRVLRELEEDIDREKLRHLLIHSKKLGTFEQKARLVRDAIDDLLEADDDLALMYLSERKATGKPRDEENHQEVEMLLESYHKICDEIVEISGNLISNIRNTEEVVKAILDANRNQLMLLELKFSVGTLGLAGGTLIAGLYGMNLENHIEDNNIAFGAVSAVCFGLSAIIAIYGMRKLRKVQKVKMWGENFRDIVRGENRGNWRTEALEHEGRAERVKRLREAKQGGPVMWPGMEGLGVHKLPGGATNEDGPSVTLHDDIWEKAREEERRAKAVTKLDKR